VLPVLLIKAGVGYWRISAFELAGSGVARREGEQWRGNPATSTKINRGPAVGRPS
jgi:hypothetical protein